MKLKKKRNDRKDLCGSLLWCNVGITFTRAKALHFYDNSNNNNNKNIFDISFIVINNFTSNKQRNASLISCYPENNVKPSRLK